MDLESSMDAVYNSVYEQPQKESLVLGELHHMRQLNTEGLTEGYKKLTTTPDLFDCFSIEDKTTVKELFNKDESVSLY